MTHSPSIIGLFCEDIREEKSGSNTIVGIFPDNIAVGTIPAMLPRLAIYVRTNLDPNVDVEAIVFRLVVPGQPDIPLTEIDRRLISETQEKARIASSPLVGLISRITFAPFQVHQAGRILLKATVGKNEYVVGSLNVQTETPKQQISSPAR